MSAPENMLTVQGLRCGYGRIPILHGIDLTVAAGETVGILGHNGMGKTTLLKALMGYLPLTGGHVHFERQDISRASPHQRNRLGMGYLPQGRGIFADLSVRDNLRMGVVRDASQPDQAAVDALLVEFPRL